MRRLVLTLAILAACDHVPVTGDGSTGDDAAEESSTGDDGAESSSGEEPQLEKWTGDGMVLRVLEVESDSCEDACGASVCASSFGDGRELLCDSEAGQNECTCADLTDHVTDTSNVAASECFLAASTESRLAVDPPLWSHGSCDDYCGAFGFACLGTVWEAGRSCPSLKAPNWDLYLEGPTQRPSEISGPGGAFVVLCAM